MMVLPSSTTVPLYSSVDDRNPVDGSVELQLDNGVLTMMVLSVNTEDKEVDRKYIEKDPESSVTEGGKARPNKNPNISTLASAKKKIIF